MHLSFTLTSRRKKEGAGQWWNVIKDMHSSTVLEILVLQLSIYILSTTIMEASVVRFTALSDSLSYFTDSDYKLIQNIVQHS